VEGGREAARVVNNEDEEGAGAEHRDTLTSTAHESDCVVSRMPNRQPRSGCAFKPCITAEWLGGAPGKVGEYQIMPHDEKLFGDHL
jgi:hypothetical protein